MQVAEVTLQEESEAAAAFEGELHEVEAEIRALDAALGSQAQGEQASQLLATSFWQRPRQPL